MSLKEKYGEWGIVLGATEGVGKAFCEKLAAEGINVVLVGRREEKLNVLADEIRAEYNVETLVVRADFSDESSVEQIFEKTKDLKMGFMTYVACYHGFGELQNISWEEHMKMLNVNVITFLKCFYHYLGIFTKQGHGGIVNVSSLTGISASPYNAQYGAGKSYILKLTEAVAFEARKNNVDVLAITLGTTITPSLLSNLPQGPDGERVMKAAQTPEACVEEAFEGLGKNYSIISGEHNRASVHKWRSEHSADEYIAYMGSFYER